MRRLGLVLVLALVAGGLAACGSGHGSNSAEDQIKSAYATFFSPKTSLSGRVAALQNGSQFKSVIQGFASNPLAKSASATVSSVTLQGANKAKVVYVIKLGGTSLPKQTGTAVRENGTWKVGYASLCRLVELQGTTPPACKNATS